MHTMNLIKEHEGTEEWLCSTCGRHMLVNWHPKFKRTVLDAGDLSVGHNGFKNRILPKDLLDEQVGGHSTREDAIKPVDEARLTPWASWMNKTNFSNLWNSDVQ